mgnify:FL=1
MKKLSQISRASIPLILFFGLDKIVAFVRLYAIQATFDFSAELDAFNAANNLPDLLFALISGGALAMAFIPVLSEVLSLEGREAAWNLFSRVANLAFIVTAVLAVIVALLAEPLVRGEFGIAPGFTREQQDLVVELMRINLIATLIFSLSGLVMAGLQVNQHFWLPAMTPVLYNVGQIIGVVIFAPEQGMTIGGLTLPALGMGIHGMVYGVILGAVLHLGIQVPGLIRYGFRWTPALDVVSPDVVKVLRIMAPRVATVFAIQLIFIARDNLASRLAQEGAVSALTYGWMIFQVPETLIGTVIGTAMLPTLAEFFATNQKQEFQRTMERAVRVLIAITVPVAVVIALGLEPLLALVFDNLAPETLNLLIWVTRGYLLGLLGQSLQEVAVRAFYARQEPWPVFIGALLNLSVYIGAGWLLYRPLGAVGISVTDALAFTVQAIFLLLLLNRRMVARISLGNVVWKVPAAAVIAGLVVAGVMLLVTPVSPVLASLAAMGAGGLVALVLLRRELVVLVRL